MSMGLGESRVHPLSCIVKASRKAPGVIGINASITISLKYQMCLKAAVLAFQLKNKREQALTGFGSSLEII